MRRRSRIDRVRMLVVHSMDFIYLLSLFGLIGVFQLLAVSSEVPVVFPVVLGVLILAFYALSTRPFRVAVRGGRAPVLVLVISGVIALLIVLFDPYVISIWLAMLAPFVRRRITIALSILSIAIYVPLVSLIQGFQLVVLIVVAGMTLIVVGGALANLWLWRMAREAHEGQEAKAGLAVSEARLRFAGDLNDLLGQSLADISSRTAAAEELLARDPEAASREMFEIRELTRESLRSVRVAVQDYRALDLDEVLASVRAVLEAADVRCTVDADTAALPAEARTLLAGVVREGATNVLKHSTAEHCTITIKDGVLEMTNDGVTGPGSASNGLRGLTQRVAAAGGSLTAAPVADGRYLLKAHVRQALEGV